MGSCPPVAIKLRSPYRFYGRKDTWFHIWEKGFPKYGTTWNCTYFFSFLMIWKILMKCMGKFPLNPLSPYISEIFSIPIVNDWALMCIHIRITCYYCCFFKATSRGKLLCLGPQVVALIISLPSLQVYNPEEMNLGQAQIFLIIIAVIGFSNPILNYIYLSYSFKWASMDNYFKGTGYLGFTVYFKLWNSK